MPAPEIPSDRPLFTMQTLGRNGRFANQLFQYLFLRLAAERRGAALQTPAWLGQQLFGFADPPPTGPAPVLLKDEDLADPDRLLNSDEPVGRHVDFYGWFQFHTRHYRPHRDRVRELFTLKPEIRAVLDEAVTQLRGLGRPLVALHLRRGDYGNAQFFRAPARWYADWLARLSERFPNPLVYLCSENPGELTGHFEGWQVLHTGLLEGLSPDLAFLMDFHLMTQADALAISNSSFSCMAAMLNQRAQVFVRPTLEDRCLVHFDPWDTPVLMPRVLRPGEQEELDAFDRCELRSAPSAGVAGPGGPGLGVEIPPDTCVLLAREGIGDHYVVAAFAEAVRREHGVKVWVAGRPELAFLRGHFPAVERYLDWPHRRDPAELEFSDKIQGGVCYYAHFPGMELMRAVGYGDFHFLDAYRCRLGLPPEAGLARSCLPGDDEIEEARGALRRRGFRPGSTVVASVDAHTISADSIGGAFWEALMGRLAERGIGLLFNVGPTSRPPANGHAFAVPLAQFRAMTLAAGFSLGVRNGLADLVCDLPCPRAVIYPDVKWGGGPVVKGTTFGRYGLDTLPLEILWRPEDASRHVDAVLRHFETTTIRPAPEESLKIA